MKAENVKLWRMLVSKCLPDTNAIVVSVRGDSMYPILCNGDKIEVVLRTSEQYSVGDVIVFPYKNEGLIIHRILKIQEGRYFCKGDNSFRIEDILLDQAVGKAVISDDWHNSDIFIERSWYIGKLYKKLGYQSNLIKDTFEYCEYARDYLIK